MSFSTIGVIGAGTMGAGIARFFASRGLSVHLYDTAVDRATEAVATIGKGFARDVERGRMTQDQADSARAKLEDVSGFSGFVGCDLVIEAVIENQAIKTDVYQELENTVSAQCVLATNTSSLSVSGLAAKLRHPERFLGIHFFNPAHVMKFVEVIPCLQTRPELADEVSGFLREHGKAAHVAQDTPGFIVNRVARPFYGEAFHMVEQGAATSEAIDAVMRDAGRFRMGPFELTDFIGQDINIATTRSVFAAFHGDRWFLPSGWQEKLGEAGWLGKKTGRGVYRYDAEGTKIESEPFAEPEGEPTTIVFHKPPETEREKQAAALLGPLVQREGQIRLVWDEDGREAWLNREPSSDKEILLLASDQIPAAHMHVTGFPVERAVTISPMSLLRGGTCVVIGTHRATTPETIATLRATFAKLPKAMHVTRGYPGHILPRILAMIVNVACDALDRGVASVEAIDAAMKLGTGYPEGPLKWADEWGIQRVVNVLLALHRTTQDERYRVAPGLRERASLGLTFYGT